ncbi:MAG TPA: hypothetical protein VM077_02240 [Candidatus Limnocylindrales bacterium]|nr:hypothetical protein [Candidatus Limnocylindrales bacterium]
MGKSSLTIIKSNKEDSSKRKQLILSIAKKRAELKKFIVKVETLRVNLQIAQTEYMAKIGSLFLKDNHLDLEIIRFQNILSLMIEGLSYDQAAEKVAKTYYSQQIEIENEKRRIEFEKEIYEKRKIQSPELNKDIKKLWRRLISQFHPDLVQDLKEKLRRDKIMKQINRAYHEGDYDQLFKIDNEVLINQENTIDNLEIILVSITNDIDQQTETYKSLKNSEWYSWMEKINYAKKKSLNIFAETEKKLLNDILLKINTLKSLKEQVREFQRNYTDI